MHCDCEASYCTVGHRNGGCKNEGSLNVRAFGYAQRLCPACFELADEHIGDDLEVIVDPLFPREEGR